MVGIRVSLFVDIPTIQPKSDTWRINMGSCQNYCPYLGILNIRCRIIVRTQKGTLILTTTHITNPKALNPKSGPYTANPSS